MCNQVVTTAMVLAYLLLEPSAILAQADRGAVRVERLLDRPIITPDIHPSIGPNIQGPSLIKVPDWVAGRLGKYYLYFADHKGRYIRLAYADELLGPWRIHVPGSLQLAGSFLLTDPPTGPADELARLRATRKPANLSSDVLTEATTPHIASPDIRVDGAQRRIAMSYHGLNGLNEQVTRVATSADGLHFEARPESSASSMVDGAFTPTYSLGRPGGRKFGRSTMRVCLCDGDARTILPFEGRSRGFVRARLFNPNMRHAALLKRGNTLLVFWTQVGDAPERILLSTIVLSEDWTKWSETQRIRVFRPERPWEGADAPLAPSLRSTAYGRVNQRRDPAVFELANGRTFGLYAVSGESGIAIAESSWTVDAGPMAEEIASTA